MQSEKIPIQNIYYLLAYAWDLFRDGEEANVDQSRCPDAHNLLAMLLAGAVRKLATKGMDKGYVAFVEETPRLRGRIQVLPSYRRLTHLAGRMICEFDELTADTLPNRIIKSTCLRLLQYHTLLTRENRAGVHAAVHLLHDIPQIPLTSRDFSKVQLHRNNRHYRLLLHVCQMLFESYLPEEKTGQRRFHSILSSETVMHRLFENFVRNFAIRHCRDARVSAMHIQWQGEIPDNVAPFIPRMMTDVTLDRADHKIILDCKFYRDALIASQSATKMRSEHLYQLVAYLQNKGRRPGWSQVVGKLLYPAVKEEVALKFRLLDHQVEIHSIDLDRPWKNIHDALYAVLLP